MKVAMVTHYWKGSPGGGMRVYLEKLVEALAGLSVDTRVVFREGQDPSQYRVAVHRVFFPFLGYLALRKISPDIIHTHDSWFCLLAGALHRWIHGSTLIHTFHSEPAGPASPLQRWFFRLLQARCDGVTFVSEGLKEKLAECYQVEFHHPAITYAGAETPRVTPEQVKAFRDRFSLGKEATILLVQAFTANRLKADGVRLLIRAVGELVPGYPHLMLVATRDGAFVPELKAYAGQMGMGDHVLFTGDVEDPSIPVAACDLFLHPWLGKSGVSLVILEAMASCKPIIATSPGRESECLVHGKTGCLVAPEVHRVGEAVAYLLEHPRFAQEMGVAARRAAEERFTWARTARQFVDLYREFRPAEEPGHDR